MRHHTLIITAGLTLWAAPALSQTLVAPNTASATSDIGGSFGITQTINGGGLIGADINATHEDVTNSNYAGKFWISNAGVPNPITLTYNYTTPQSLDGVAIWASTFVLPKQGHYTGDGTITCFDLEVDHAQGTQTYTGLALDPTINGAQQFGFDSTLANVSQIRIITREDDRPLPAGDRNMYLSEFRGLTGNVARPITNVPRCGAFVQIVQPVAGALTNDDTPTISGQANSVTNITVVISNNLGVPVQTLSPTLAADGSWTIDASALPDGDYTASVTAVNGVIPVVGNSVSFSVDTLAPTLTLTTPADGAVTNDDTPTISGTAEPGATLTVTITDSNGAAVETINPMIAADGTWSVDASALPDGQYTIMAQALDAAGNSAMLAPVGITIDTLAPAVTLLTPADGALTNDTTPAIGGTTEPGATIVVTLLDSNGATIATLNPTVDAAGAWTIDSSALADGSYSVSATSTDAAGNSSSAGPNGFELDATAPALAINTPAAGLQTQDTTPTLGGVGEAGLTVTVEVRDLMGAVVFSATPTVAPDGTWSVDTSMLSDGAYTVGAASTDAAGNSSLAGPVAFIIDTVAPAVTLLTPADGALTNDDTPTISGTAEPDATLTVTLLDAAGMTVATLNPTVDAAGAWTIDSSALPEGQYTVNVTATDGAGNSTPATSSFELDLTPPPVAISSPTAGQILPTRQADVTGTSEPGAAINVELIDSNGMTISTQQATADANGDFSVSFQGLDNGAYTLNATSTDAAGNSASEQVQFSVDSVAPTLTVSSPMDDSSTNQGMTTITGNTDADATVVIIIRDAQGAEIETINATVDANGDFSAPTTMTLAEGDYVIEVTSTRQNGLMTQVNVDLSVDTTAPALTIAQPAADAITNDTTPTISGTSEPGLEISVSVKDAQGQEVFTGTATADAQGAWTIDSSELGDGAYTVEATSSDDAGNTTTTDPSSFSIDATAPMIAITSPAAGSTIQDTTPTISGTAEPGATVEILVDGVKVGEATADAQGAWSFDVTDELTLGEHTIVATSSDDAGNMGSTGEVKITIEALPVDPVVITSPTEGGTVTGPDVIVSGTGEPGSTVTVTINGQSKDVTVGADGSWSVTFNDVPAGDTTIMAKAGEMEVNVSVSVVDPVTDPDGYLISGGGCSSSPTAPTGSAWLLGLLGLIGLGRRKRR